MLIVKRCFNVSNKYFMRPYKRRANIKRNLNPGVNKRFNILKEENPDLANLDEESLQKLEQEFDSSKQLREVHKREFYHLKNKIRFSQVERKYFNKQKLPNMLLWAEKEQIRLLSQTDPDMWTPEKLSESFPTTPEIIQKLLKSQWKPDNEKRIKIHDKKVTENWRAFETGNLQIPDSLANHLKSFTFRKKILFKKEENMPVKTETKEDGEFFNIIKSYKNDTNLKQNNNTNSIPSKTSIEEDSFILGKKSYSRFHRKEYTLETMKKAIDDGELSDNMSKKLLENSQNKDIKPRGCLNEVVNSKIQKFDDTNIVEIDNKKLSNNDTTENILMHIKIPKEKWKKGCLYKVNNCYYADDGEFLYRV